MKITNYRHGDHEDPESQYSTPLTSINPVHTSLQRQLIHWHRFMASVTVPNYNIGVVERGPDSEQLLCDHSWPLQVPAPVPHSLKILEVDDCAYDCQSLLQTPSNLTTVLWSDHYIRYPPGDKLEFMRSELRAWFREDEQFWYDALFFTYQGYLHIQHQTLGDVLPKMDAAIIHGMNRLLDLYLTHLTAIYVSLY